MRVLAALSLAAALAACGSEPEGVTVTEAEPVGRLPPPAPRASAAFDTVYADSGLYMDSALDSLRAAAEADSLADTPAAPASAASDFRAFWPRFQAAVREGEEEVAALARLDGEGISRARLREVYAARLAGGPFREGALALTARDFRREGAAREAAVVVGYDARGRVVRQDEAVRDSILVLRFEAVDGAYRLVRLAVTE